ncbi:MAG: D-Ala-D-Ala carboxypeptidase family metallohydrolase [Spirulina sp.]
MSFNSFIESLNLSFFQPYEFLIHTDRPNNQQPPERLWGNIVVTALVLDKLRAEFNRPLIITSCYRTPAYNSRLTGAASLSQHQAFTAADFSISGVSPSTVARAARNLRNQWIAVPIDFDRVQVRVPRGYVPFWELPQRRNNGQLEVKFLGGINAYSRFVHVDSRGQNTNW